MLNSTLTGENGAPKEDPIVLSYIEKRSLVFARLPSEERGNALTKPGQLEEIPYATMAWIEHLIKKGDTEWPWFRSVLQFIQGPEYKEIKAALISEIEQERERWNKIAQGGNSFRRGPSIERPSQLIERPVSVSQKCQSPQARASEKTLDRPYFWDNLDPSWWREQP